MDAQPVVMAAIVWKVGLRHTRDWHALGMVHGAESVILSRDFLGRNMNIAHLQWV